VSVRLLVCNITKPLFSTLSAHIFAPPLIQSAGAPHGATMWLVTTCALSVALGALIYNLFSILDAVQQNKMSYAQPEVREKGHE